MDGCPANGGRNYPRRTAKGIGANARQNFKGRNLFFSDGVSATPGGQVGILALHPRTLKEVFQERSTFRVCPVFPSRQIACMSLPFDA